MMMMMMKMNHNNNSPLSGPQRRHAMESLTCLSKYLGCYDRWQEMRKRYSLKWSNGNESLATLQRFFNEERSLDHIIQTVKEMMRVLPRQMALVIRHALLRGLRPSEACESVRLLNVQNLDISYYNRERQMLQHYLYPEIFFRATKKAYSSYITLDNLQPITNLRAKTPAGTPFDMHAGVGISTWR
jgi:hypothetical protein